LPNDSRGVLVERRSEKCGYTQIYCVQWIAKIVAEDGNKLLSQLRNLSFVLKRRLSRGQPLLSIEVESDQVGEQSEHIDRCSRSQFRWARIQRAQSAKKLTVRKIYWDRDVALKAIQLGRGMAAKEPILGDTFDDHDLATRTDFVANGGFHREFTTRLKAEGDFVSYCTRNPTIRGHSRYRGEP
jgi:hypothetical protein